MAQEFDIRVDTATASAPISITRNEGPTALDSVKDIVFGSVCPTYAKNIEAPDKLD